MTDTLQQDNPTLNLNEDVLEEYQQYFDRLQVEDTFGPIERLGIRGALRHVGIGTSDEREKWFSGDMQNLFNSVLASGGKEDLKNHLDFAEILFADIHRVTGTNVIDRINLLEFAKNHKETLRRLVPDESLVKAMVSYSSYPSKGSETYNKKEFRNLYKNYYREVMSYVRDLKPVFGWNSLGDMGETPGWLMEYLVSGGDAGGDTEGLNIGGLRTSTGRESRRQNLYQLLDYGGYMPQGEE